MSSSVPLATQYDDAPRPIEGQKKRGIFWRRLRSYPLRTKLISALLAAATESLFASAEQTAVSVDACSAANLDALRIEAGFSIFSNNYLDLPPERRPASPEDALGRPLLLQLGCKDSDPISSHALLGSAGEDKSDRNYFTEGVETGLPYVSPIQVAVALGNADLYAQTQDRLLINEIDQKVEDAVDVESVFQIAVREVGRAVGAHQTSVRLIDFKKNGNGRIQMENNRGRYRKRTALNHV